MMVLFGILALACWFIFRVCLVALIWVGIGFTTPLYAIITIAATIGGLVSMIFELDSFLENHESQK